MLTAYIGATFQLVGSLQQDGSPADFTGWAVSASLFDQSGVVLISALTFMWVDVTKGLFTLAANNTSTWPPSKARIDMKLVTPVGEVVLGPPVFIRINQSPLS